MKLKAAALNLVIVIALVIGVICGSLVALAYFFDQSVQRSFKIDKLQRNVESGINILLAEPGIEDVRKIAVPFEDERDTLILQRKRWGAFMIGEVTAFLGKDTAGKIFMIGGRLDSAKWSALYIIDEDRNISVSGRTKIIGDVYLPKAGIKEAYVNNGAYEGDDRLVIGKKRTSDRQLPKLDEKVIGGMLPVTDAPVTTEVPDSLKRAFDQPTMSISLGKRMTTIRSKLEGNIYIRSDTLVTISAEASLQDVIISAPCINVENGFKGSCQIYATDSLSVGKNCRLMYPSVLAVISTTEKALGQRKLTLGSFTQVDGIIICYEKAHNELRPTLQTEKDVSVHGEVYTSGALDYQNGLKIFGSTSMTRALYKASYTRYENYLINVELDATKLSKDYLTSKLMPSTSLNNQVLRWLK